MMMRSSGAVLVLASALTLSACGGEGEGTEAEAGGAGAGGQGKAGSPANGSGNAGKSNDGGAAGAKPTAGAGGGAGAGGAPHGGGGGSGGGAGAGGDGGVGGQVTTPAMLEPLVDAFCATARACCAGSDEVVMLDNCESEFASKNETASSLAAGAITLDATALAVCVAAYEAAATSCEMNPVLEACEGVVRGKLADGATCSLGSECGATPGPNTCLITEQNADMGVCKKVPHAQVNEECVFTCYKGEDCSTTTYGAADSLLALCFEDENLYCDHESEPAKCQPLRPTGADCDDDDQCGHESECDIDESKCRPLAKLGETCGRCISSLSCVEGKCKSPPFASFNTCEGRSLGPY
jgi:hypothetical protein